MNKKSYFPSINGIKAIAALAIVLFHVYYNGKFSFTKFRIGDIIMHLNAFVIMFFMLSAFGMCCGYYDKIKEGAISLKEFYLKRYVRIFPFLALMVILDLIYSGFSGQNVFESFSHITLYMGFVPYNEMHIVGVAWSMGVIFAFYIMFPFFVFMLWSKRSAWFFLAITLLLKVAGYYFKDTINFYSLGNIMSWITVFIVGGIIFLYKDFIIKIFNKKSIIPLLMVAVCIVLRVLVSKNSTVSQFGPVIETIGFAFMIMYAMVEQATLLGNKVFNFIGKYCFEIYLAHMAVFRILQKVGALGWIKTPWLSYIVLYVITVVASLVVAVVANKIIQLLLPKKIAGVALKETK